MRHFFKNKNGVMKGVVNAAIGAAAGVVALVSPVVPVMAEDVVPVIDMGTFENSYEPTDDWIKKDWEYEKKDDFIILREYTGLGGVVEVPGKVTISGTSYKVKICNETFNHHNSIEEIDFKAVDGQKVTVYGQLDGAFADDDVLEVLDLTGFDASGVTDFKDILKTDLDSPITLKGASESFISEVSPLLKGQHRYLGTVKVKAKVTLSGKALSAKQFSFRLYRDSVTSNNLLSDAENGADGSIDFGEIQISDVTKPVKLIAVQDAVDGYKNKTGNLSVMKTIKLKADGTLTVTGE